MLVGILGIAGYLVVSGMGASPPATSVRTYAQAWARGDARTMYAQLTPESQREYSLEQFTQLVRRARDTATVARIDLTHVEEISSSAWRVSSRITTRAFGVIEKPLELPVDGAGENARVKWARNLVFPGMPQNVRRLSRDTEMPLRGDILANDGTPLAVGEGRSSPDPALSQAVVGQLGPIPDERRDYYYARGYPASARIGVSGLERFLESSVAGQPGGTLRAGPVLLASTNPQQSPDTRSTISVPVERAAIQAIAGRATAGVVAIAPRTGAVLAYAGSPFSSLQPPGSTFKIVTLTGALEAGITEPGSTFPEVQSVKLSGVDFENADKELCGGTLTQAFAKSCNSVFGPLGAKLGASRLRRIADRFGFDGDPPLPGIRRSTMPTPAQLSDDLAVGSAAIGQNTVQATGVQMALISATIGLGGLRPELTVSDRKAAHRAATTRVAAAETAREVERMMIASVAEGTGSNALIPGVRVAGKTGTAELKTTQIACNPNLPRVPADSSTTTTSTSTTSTTSTNSSDPDKRPCPEPTDDDTTAWFTAYAPAGKPRVAVSVFIVGGGQGRDSAAPAARQVIQSAL